MFKSEGDDAHVEARPYSSAPFIKDSKSVMQPQAQSCARPWPWRHGRQLIATRVWILHECATQQSLQQCLPCYESTVGCCTYDCHWRCHIAIACIPVCLYRHLFKLFAVEMLDCRLCNQQNHSRCMTSVVCRLPPPCFRFNQVSGRGPTWCSDSAECRSRVSGTGHEDHAMLVYNLCSKVNKSPSVWGAGGFPVTHVDHVSLQDCGQTTMA